MNQRLYSIYDHRSKMYGIPFVAHNDDIAKRTTAMSLMSAPPDHLMVAFSSDYELVYIGDLTDKGELVQISNVPTPLCFLSDIVQAFQIEQRRKEIMLNGIRMQNEVSENTAE